MKNRSTEWSDTVRGIAFALVAQAIFTISDTCAKLLSAHYSVFQIISMQALVSGSIVVTVLAYTRQLSLDGIANPLRVLSRGLLAGVGALSNFYAFSRLPLADVYAIIFCAPLLVTAVSAPFLREHVGWHRWVAVTVGFGGMLTMVQPGVTPLTTGHLAAVVAAIVSTGVVLLLRSSAGQEPRSFMVAAVVVAHFIVGLPGTLYYGRIPAPRDLVIVLLGGSAMAAAQFMMVESLRLAPAATVAPIQYTKLIWGILIGIALFGDVPEPHVLLGTVIVVASVLYIVHSEKSRR